MEGERGHGEEIQRNKTTLQKILGVPSGSIDRDNDVGTLWRRVW